MTEGDVGQTGLGSVYQVVKTANVRLGNPLPMNTTGSILIMAAAAAVPLNSDDPIDRCITKEAAERGDLRQITQSDLQRATPTNRAGIVTICTPDGRKYRIVRGEVSAVLKIVGADAKTSLSAREGARVLRSQGYNSLAVASAALTADSTLEPWRFLGIIPFHAQRGALRLLEKPEDWVYVPEWDAALRIMHWVSAACVVTLAFTGLFIASPIGSPSRPAAEPYTMGYARLIHYCAGWILIASAMGRIADLFMSSYPYARWPMLWPIKNRREWRATVELLRGYLFLNTSSNPTWIGLNPLQAISYTLIYGIGLIMIFTGLALYGLYYPVEFPYNAFQWMNNWVGAREIRTIHYIGMWSFLVFVPIHIYLVIRADTIDRDGTIDAMVGGGVWVRKNAEIVDKKLLEGSPK